MLIVGCVLSAFANEGRSSPHKANQKIVIKHPVGDFLEEGPAPFGIARCAFYIITLHDAKHRRSAALRDGGYQGEKRDFPLIASAKEFARSIQSRLYRSHLQVRSVYETKVEQSSGLQTVDKPIAAWLSWRVMPRHVPANFCNRTLLIGAMFVRLPGFFLGTLRKKIV